MRDVLLHLTVFQDQHLLGERWGEPNNKELSLNISNKTSITCVRNSVSLVVMSFLSKNTHTLTLNSLPPTHPPFQNNAYPFLASQFNAQYYTCTVKMITLIYSQKLALTK